MGSCVQIISESFPSEPGLDTAVSRVILDRVSAGEHPETLRLYTPGRVVAFARRDVLSPGYRAAVNAAHACSFQPVERIAGGRAAAFTERSIAFSWAIPDEDPRSRVQAWFVMVSELIAGTFTDIGVPAAVGEVPGEYCPGKHSVHHSGRIKLMGVGQRLARRATHLGGVIIVDRPDLVRRVLVPVYRALELDWDPQTAGALTDVRSEVTATTVIEALIDRIGRSQTVVPGTLDPEVLAAARARRSDHLPERIA